MSEIDFTRYSSVEQIERDIKSVSIQGATNVAIATFEGLKLFLRDYECKSDYNTFLGEVRTVAQGLANARPNEPLAKNGVKYIFHKLETEHKGITDLATVKNVVGVLTQEYLDTIKASKKKIIETSFSVMDGVDEIFTHCHSSTSENVIKARNKQIDDLQVVCTETRPLYQGRITAQNLIDADVDTTLIADSAAESFIIGRGSIGVDVILIGGDEITMQGDTINKIGSWGVALAAYFASRPIYVVSSILKVDTDTLKEVPQIEMRDASEIWPDAPDKLKMINPSFDLIDSRLITGFITEVGILKPDEVHKVVRKDFGWLF